MFFDTSTKYTVVSVFKINYKSLILIRILIVKPNIPSHPQISIENHAFLKKIKLLKNKQTSKQKKQQQQKKQDSPKIDAFISLLTNWSRICFAWT